MEQVTNLGDITRRDVPDHPIIIDLREPERPRTVTAATLRALVAAVARGLLAQGHRRGDRIAIVSANRWEYVASYFGIMSAGMVAVPVNHRLSRETVAFVLRDAEVRAVIAEGERIGLVPPDVRAYALDLPGTDGFLAMLDWGEFEAVVPRDGELAKILYTSGSTGRPKGVPLGHAGQLWALRKSWTGGDAPLRERSIIVAPTYHKNGLFFTSVAASNGVTFFSMPRFDAAAYLRLVHERRCTLLSGIPTMFALMARERDVLASVDLRCVTTVTIGSAPLTDTLLETVRRMFPNALCQNGYGTTEGGPAVFGPHPRGRPRPNLALGVPVEGAELRLVGGATPDEGVLHLRTPALMSGYLNLPELSAQRLVDGWYDSGDVMRRDAEGFYYFVGRADDMFTCGGENVFPGEVEQLLERMPGVAQAAVVAVPDEIKGAIPVAFVVASAGGALTEAEVKAYALREGPAYAHPRFVLFRDSIPVASTHKVDRGRLVAEATAHARARGRS